jgi:hypothetical protein
LLTLPLHCLRLLLLLLAAAAAGRLDMQKPPLHQLQLRSISVALLSLHLASAFGSSIPAREAFDMGVQLSQLIGLGHTIGPPGGVLLMRKLADVLPPPLVGWRVKVGTWCWCIQRRCALLPQLRRHTDPASNHCNHCSVAVWKCISGYDHVMITGACRFSC